MYLPVLLSADSPLAVMALAKELNRIRVKQLVVSVVLAVPWLDLKVSNLLLAFVVLGL